MWTRRLRNAIDRSNKDRSRQSTKMTTGVNFYRVNIAHRYLSRIALFGLEFNFRTTYGWLVWCILLFCGCACAAHKWQVDRSVYRIKNDPLRDDSIALEFKIVLVTKELEEPTQSARHSQRFRNIQNSKQCHIWLIMWFLHKKYTWTQTQALVVKENFYWGKRLTALTLLEIFQYKNKSNTITLKTRTIAFNHTRKYFNALLFIVLLFWCQINFITS